MFSFGPRRLSNKIQKQTVKLVMQAGCHVAAMGLLLEPSGFIVRVHMLVKQEPHSRFLSKSTPRTLERTRLSGALYSAPDKSSTLRPNKNVINISLAVR